MFFTNGTELLPDWVCTIFRGYLYTFIQLFTFVSTSLSLPSDLKTPKKLTFSKTVTEFDQAKLVLYEGLSIYPCPLLVSSSLSLPSDLKTQEKVDVFHKEEYRLRPGRAYTIWGGGPHATLHAQDLSAYWLSWCRQKDPQKPHHRLRPLKVRYHYPTWVYNPFLVFTFT